VSLNGDKLFGGKRRRKRSSSKGKRKSKSTRKMSGRGAEALSGGKKRRKSAKRSGKRSGKKSGKRSSKRSKKTMGPSFSEQLITLANALQKQGVAGAGKPKKHKKGKAIF
jgi:hypothetical protein